MLAKVSVNVFEAVVSSFEVASKDETRRAIQSVNLTCDESGTVKVIATDGFSLVSHTFYNENELSVTGLKNFNFSRDSLPFLKSLIKGYTKSGYVIIDATDRAITATLLSGQNFNITSSDAEFPKMAYSIASHETKEHSIALDFDLLKSVMKSMEGSQRGRNKRKIRISFSKNDSPIVVESVGEDNFYTSKGIVMPYKS